MARRFPLLSLAALLLAVPGLAAAAAPGIPLQYADINLRDQASLQRGARLYVNYCLGCHSLQYVRYNQLAEGLGLTDELVAEHLRFTGDSPHDQMRIAMPAEDAGNWFGMAPPDLTLVARARSVNWVYTFLKSFYVDPASPTTGANNKVLEGTAMPYVLWDLQGLQAPVYRQGQGDGASGQQSFEGFELVAPGQLTPAEFDRAALDITAFLSWTAEPMQLQRQRLGMWVLLFLFFLFALSYLLYKEIWKDVK
jgi:ubiquinol-cytochrome c reductase cytochrome c1 subunit